MKKTHAKWLSYFSVVLILTLIVSVSAVPTSALADTEYVPAAGATNIISNGTFDQKILTTGEHDVSTNFVAVDSNGSLYSAYDGDGSPFQGSADNPLAGLAAGMQGMRQSINGKLTSGKTYRLSFKYARNVGGSEAVTPSSVWVKIRYSNGTGWFNLWEQKFSNTASYKFVDCTAYITLNLETYNYLQIHFDMTHSDRGPGNAYVDDIELVECEAVTVLDSVKSARPLDEDFSSFNTTVDSNMYAKHGNVLWYFNNVEQSIADGGTALNGGVPDGNNTLNVKNYFTWIRIFVPVQSGKTYTLRYKWSANNKDEKTITSKYAHVSKITQNSSGAYTITWKNSSNAFGGTEADITASGWKLNEYTRDIKAESDWLCIGFQGESNSAYSFFDDIMLVEKSDFRGYNLRLDGKIGLGFNASLNSELKSGGYVNFKVDNGSDVRVNVTSAFEEADGTHTFYCPLSSLEMNASVSATLYYADGTPAGATVTKTGNTYIEQLKTDSSVADNVKSLGSAIQNYTAFSEKYFGNASASVDESAIEGVNPVSENNFSVSGSADGVSFYGYDLVLNDSTDLRLYFTADSAPSFTVDGVATETEQFGEYYYVTVNNIAAHELGKKYTVVANDGLTVEASALSYANSVMISANADQNLKKLCCAIYKYSDAAMAYKNAQ